MNHINTINSSNDDDSQRLETKEKPEFKFLVSNCCGVKPPSHFLKLAEICAKCGKRCNYVYEDER